MTAVSRGRLGSRRMSGHGYKESVSARVRWVAEFVVAVILGLTPFVAIGGWVTVAIAGGVGPQVWLVPATVVVVAGLVAGTALALGVRRQAFAEMFYGIIGFVVSFTLLA